MYFLLFFLAEHMAKLNVAQAEVGPLIRECTVSMHHEPATPSVVIVTTNIIVSSMTIIINDDDHGSTRVGRTKLRFALHQPVADVNRVIAWDE